MKTSSLGDVIHNLPILHDMTQQIPDCQIDWVVEESFAQIPKMHPLVNKVIPVAIRRWRKHLLSLNTLSEIREFKSNLQAKEYDFILDSQGLIKSAGITMWAKGETLGLDKHSARECIASFAYDKKFHVTKGMHAVVRNRLLAARALGYADPASAPLYGLQAPNNKEIFLPQPYAMGFHGTSRASKLWPIESWVKLGKALQAQHIHLCLPWGNVEEEKRALEIQSSIGNTDCSVLPKLDIQTLASVIQNAAFCVGVDTGLSHLSVALGIPTVALYTDTNPALTGIYPGEGIPAINLGNTARTPTVLEVLQTLESLDLIDTVNPMKNQ